MQATQAVKINEAPESGSETEDDTKPEYQYEYGEEDESVESSPKRKVAPKKSKSAARNQRRREREKIRRDQAKKHAKDRLDTSHANMRLGNGASRNTRQKPRPPSVEILSDEETHAKPRSVSPKTTSELTQEWKNKPWKKHIKKEVKIRSWEDQEPEEEPDHEVEEEDVQDTKVPKIKKKNQRQ